MHSHRQTKQLKSPHKEKQLKAFPQTDKTANKIVELIAIERKKQPAKIFKNVPTDRQNSYSNS